MRTLKFVVIGQTIKRDPNCDFEGLTPGSDGYLRAVFAFSPEWTGLTKVAAFRSGNKDYEPQELKDGFWCDIPAAVLKRPIFNIRVLGKKGETKLTTNKVFVHQNGGAT